MKYIILLIFIISMAVVPAGGLAFDCAQINDEIQANMSNEAQLKNLSMKHPECGNIWRALGDFYYARKMWEETEKSYEKAQRLLPGDKQLASRLMEVRKAQTKLVKNQEELLLYRRGLGGMTSAGPGLPHTTPPVGTDKPVAEPARSVDADAAHQSSQLLSKKADSTGSRSKKRVAGTTASRPLTTEQPSPPRRENVSMLIQFDYNSARINPKGQEMLDRFADILNQELAGRIFYIQGHTDNIGGPDYNMSLSLERARSVKDYLTQKGVARDRLEIEGFGYQKPIGDNATEEGRSENRRVEFKEK